MKRGSRINSLLTELLIVIFFFALASTVLVKVYAGSRSISNRAEARNDALLEAQNLAEQIYAAGDIDVLFDSLSDYRHTEEGWERTLPGARIVAVFPEAETGAGGVLRKALVCVYLGASGSPDFSLDCSRYIPGEVAK